MPTGGRLNGLDEAEAKVKPSGDTAWKTPSEYIFGQLEAENLTLGAYTLPLRTMTAPAPLKMSVQVLSPTVFTKSAVDNYLLLYNQEKNKVGVLQLENKNLKAKIALDEKFYEQLFKRLPLIIFALFLLTIFVCYTVFKI